jgi:hypothetical protein
MTTFEDRNRDSVKREDPREEEREKHVNPDTREGGESKDKYSREGLGTPHERNDETGPGSRSGDRGASSMSEEE